MVESDVESLTLQTCFGITKVLRYSGHDDLLPALNLGGGMSVRCNMLHPLHHAAPIYCNHLYPLKGDDA